MKNEHFFKPINKLIATELNGTIVVIKAHKLDVATTQNNWNGRVFGKPSPTNDAAFLKIAYDVACQEPQECQGSYQFGTENTRTGTFCKE